VTSPLVGLGFAGEHDGVVAMHVALLSKFRFCSTAWQISALRTAVPRSLEEV